jgi:hypothetical protein
MPCKGPMGGPPLLEKMPLILGVSLWHSVFWHPATQEHSINDRGSITLEGMACQNNCVVLVTWNNKNKRSKIARTPALS